ncbi:conserved hypothetical protein, partial [Trichinella spiralis]|uniref:hypothetical protein n=1 Tax=Trichinella spiralis TaxID=6334 RepID=UPI0001EFE83E
SLSPDNPVPGNASLKKKRKLFSKLTTVIFRVRLRYRAIELNANPTERLKRYSLSPLLGSGISTGFPFENIRQLHTTTTGDDTIASTTTHTQIIIQSYNSCRKFEQAFADRLTHVQLLFTWNLAPLQPSRFSLEYLLLPPRSAPTAAPSELTLKTLQSNTVATFLPVSTRSGMGLELKRYPFSGLVDSAGELLHTPWRIPTSMATRPAVYIDPTPFFWVFHERPMFWGNP